MDIYYGNYWWLNWRILIGREERILKVKEGRGRVIFREFKGRKFVFWICFGLILRFFLLDLFLNYFKIVNYGV